MDAHGHRVEGPSSATGELASIRQRTSSRRVARRAPGVASSMPRASAASSTPASCSAVRSPAAALAGRPCTSTARAAARAARAGARGVASGDRAGDERSGHHDALALDQEGAVDRQPGGIGVAGRGRELAGCFLESGAQRRDALAGEGRDRQDRRTGEAGGGQDVGDFEAGELGGLGVDGVDLVQRDDEAGELEEFGDLQMLAGLRRIPLRRRPRRAAGAAPRRARRARCGESARGPGRRRRRARSPARRRGRSVGRRQVREAEIEGDTASLLFFETVAVDAGERADERSLAVIDVAGGADEDRAQRLTLRPGARGRGGSPWRRPRCPRSAPSVAFMTAPSAALPATPCAPNSVTRVAIACRSSSSETCCGR